VQRDGSIPRHVAVVMDGNGRWAKKRLMPRVFGHKHGMDNVVGIIHACAERGVEFLTVYAFSSENWKRPEDEVSGLMSLVLVGVAKYLKRLSDDGVRIKIVGDRSAVSPRLCEAWDEAERSTAHNKRLTLSVAFNYGGRWDIVQAARRLVALGLAPEQITEQRMSQEMALSYAPDPDLFIRTGGEVRVSNFLLWQIAYAELYFTDCLWPDFDEAQLDLALAAYATRERRFGGVIVDPASIAQDG
jgi:undecaprenyl diphosphate synthase